MFASTRSDEFRSPTLLWKGTFTTVAFALIILLFCFWSIVGFGLVSWLRGRRNLLQNALLAPVAGLSATVLLVMWVNAFVPLRFGGPVVALILLALSVWLLRRTAPVLPVRRLLPFVAVLLLAAVLTGYPTFVFGFNWISYGNDDMANYCLGAKLFLNHAQFVAPSASDVIADRDVSLFYWFFLVVSAIRHGAEETLGWVCSVTGLSSHQAFMPFILGMNLVLISSSGALVLQSRKFRQAALLTCFALSLSALTTLGSTYQLLGQVAGLSTLTGACAVMLQPAKRKKKEMIFSGLLAAGMGMMYPEVIPFFGISYILFHSILVLQRREEFRSLLGNLLTTIAFVLLFLNIYSTVTAVTLVRQVGSGTSLKIDPGQSLFPFYLTPAAFAYLWGFFPIGVSEVGILLDVGVIAGITLFLLVTAGACWLAWRGHPSSVIFVVLAAVTIQLFRMRIDFGLYKMAMYIQPFLLGTLSLCWVQLFRRYRQSPIRRRLLLLGITLVLMWGVRSQLHYTRRSLGDQAGGGLVEIPHASRVGLVSALLDLPQDTRVPIVADTSNVILAKLESTYRGPIYYPTKDFFAGFVSSEARPEDFLNLFVRTYGTFALELSSKRASQFSAYSFDMHGALPETNHFSARRGILGTEQSFLELGFETSALNRRNPQATLPVVRLVPLATKRNHLLFVASRLGSTFDASMKDRAAGRVSMYQLETDFFRPGQTMVSIGRDSLYRVVNASSPVRMVLEYTASLNGDRINKIPPAGVIGNEWQMFDTQGRGSARLFSPPIRPQRIDDGEYLGLDMGTWGQRFSQARSWIMGLWGTDVRNDSRRITGFARDISLISNEQYAALNPPQAIQKFPHDLANKDLEYCGIYEEGWIGESSYAILKNPEDSGSLVVSLQISNIDGRPVSSSIQLLLDGQEVGRTSPENGAAGFQIPVKQKGKHRVELRFDRSISMPAPDFRPISGKILYMGFKPQSAVGKTDSGA